MTARLWDWLFAPPPAPDLGLPWAARAVGGVEKVGEALKLFHAVGVWQGLEVGAVAGFLLGGFATLVLVLMLVIAYAILRRRGA